MKNKKSILIILFMLIRVFLCNKVNNSSDNNLNNEDNSPIENDEYIETIPPEALEWIASLEDTLLMSGTEINTYNQKLIDENAYLTNLPDLKEEKPKGIVVNRALLLKEALAEYEDEHIETGLYVGMPVLVIDERKEWYKIQSYFYKGWTKQENIALVDLEEWQNFAFNERFVVITTPFVMVKDKLIDMGSRLPYLGVKNNCYEVLVPYLSNEGKGSLITKKVLIERNEAHIGYLPYTKRNTYIQAFKYLGIPYGWGDKDNGIDCSSFIGYIHRSMGIYLPRNSVEQKEAIGNNVDVTNFSDNEKYSALLNNNYPSMLYRPGHTMLYLGVKDDEHHVIHANGRTKDVAYEKVPDIDKIHTIAFIK